MRRIRVVRSDDALNGTAVGHGCILVLIGSGSTVRFKDVLLRLRERFRSDRMSLFLQHMSVTNETRILDVGGTADTWCQLEVRPRVTLLNMPRAGVGREGGFDTVGADGCQLPFGDASYDVVFSNSVIEHVGSADRQQAFASEVQRVGRAYWVQTPNFWFPVEAHLLTPAVHFLPKSWQRAILERGSVWEYVERPTADRREFYIEHFLTEIRLLGATELGALFPEAEILRERSLGLTKSLIAYRVSHV